MVILGGHGGGRKGEGESGRKVRTGIRGQVGMPEFLSPFFVDDAKRCTDIIQGDGLVGSQLSAPALAGKWK